jgi:hypothetical protein
MSSAPEFLSQDLPDILPERWCETRTQTRCLSSRYRHRPHTNNLRDPTRRKYVRVREDYVPVTLALNKRQPCFYASPTRYGLRFTGGSDCNQILPGPVRVAKKTP